MLKKDKNIKQIEEQSSKHEAEVQEKLEKNSTEKAVLKAKFGKSS